MEVTGRDAVSLFYGHTDRCAYNKKSISTVAVEICIFSALYGALFCNQNNNSQFTGLRENLNFKFKLQIATPYCNQRRSNRLNHFLFLLYLHL